MKDSIIHTKKKTSFREFNITLESMKNRWPIDFFLGDTQRLTSYIYIYNMVYHPIQFFPRRRKMLVNELLLSSSVLLDEVG